jgi:hypothetical protein
MRLFSGGELSKQGLVLGETFALVREADLDRTATMLVVLDRWPPPWRIYGEDPQNELQQRMSKVRRQIPLDGPTTLSDLLKTRPWAAGT